MYIHVYMHMYLHKLINGFRGERISSKESSCHPYKYTGKEGGEGEREGGRGERERG